jgi:hypothetical protein
LKLFDNCPDDHTWLLPLTPARWDNKSALFSGFFQLGVTFGWKFDEIVAKTLKLMSMPNNQPMRTPIVEVSLG